ncbi:BlaI/MecI/CopY family transcriptional regulator [Xanthovirga aplysinae]|uniref:BlaI/MecI/CopY family transcriptional regulator n=1 Tax=Xanthovirga aplysinae TaxID=2529853 RepID=UPI0012BBB409|nr:BlaI/MecI/CopY family transcriptional regulator [Xanthovirga aplysinae]MTI31213.1 BlaI/MecI/CopY family transcriptional regulator [Xanthovirga aplysinae]
MKKENLLKPTEAELEVLGVIWGNGPSTVRFVHEKLLEKKEVGYTTTLKTMQNMAKKGMLKRDENKRSHVYLAVLKETPTQKALLNRFLDAAFGGSAMKMVMQLLGNSKTSEAELEQIRKLIDKIEKDKS